MPKKNKQITYRFLSAYNPTSKRSKTERKLQETVETKSNMIYNEDRK